jgi:poly(A) polymerase
MGLSPALATAVRIAARHPDEAQAGADNVYLVGGFVRDRILGRSTQDVDIAVQRDPGDTARRLATMLRAHVFPLSEEHGAWRVALRTAVDGIEQIDITQMRGGVERDLQQRDFTINALALLPEGGMPIDPAGGLADIETRTLRLVSDRAVRADPIRALRAVRHAAELAFFVDEASADVIRRDAGLILRTAGERQRDEIARALDTPRGAPAVRLMDSLGLLNHVLPELMPAKGCAQPKEHYWDVFDHSVETVAVLDCLLDTDPASATCHRRRDALCRAWPPEDWRHQHWEEPLVEKRSRRSLLKLIGLLHDAGKPPTRTIEPDGRMRFFGHPELGADLASGVLHRLKFSTREIKIAELLIREHLRPGQLAAPGTVPTPRALYRFYRDLGDEAVDLLMLNLADGASAAGPAQRPEHWDGHVAYTGWILRQRTEQKDSVKPVRLVTGHDLIDELGIEPGPALGQVLDALVEAQAAGEIATREAALALARTLVEAGS